jgi:transposase
MTKVSVDKGQETKKHKRKLFAYMFAIMDLKTRMYVVFASSIKSKDVFDRAMMML